MKIRASAVVLTAAFLFSQAAAVAQPQGAHAPRKHVGTTSHKPVLHPAEGAAVEIITPKEGQVFRGDSVPLEFRLQKGKRGEHVHAYVDGELVGMFKSEKGTLTGLAPGRHVLELRVATADHSAELAAVDRITFTTK